MAKGIADAHTTALAEAMEYLAAASMAQAHARERARTASRNVSRVRGNGIAL